LAAAADLVFLSPPAVLQVASLSSLRPGDQRTAQGIQTGQLPRKLITCERAVGARDRFAGIQRESQQRDRLALLLTVFVYPSRSRLTIRGASGSGREKVGDNPSFVCASASTLGVRTFNVGQNA
jgi:hypothetical protein